MLLESIEYTQFAGRPNEWRLEGCSLGSINLIVGQNATGKTRILNIIGGLANLLSGDGKVPFRSGDYEVRFQKDESTVAYALAYEDSRVTKEKLDIGSSPCLDRWHGGEGQIYFAKLGDYLEFQTPTEQLAAFARRDSIQHPFLDDLHSWGKSCRHYHFGKTLGQDHFESGDIGKDTTREPKLLNPKNENDVVAIFMRGENEFPDKFTASIIRDMATIGYKIEEIGVAPPETLIIKAPFSADIVGLYVQEHELKGRTEQLDMSQGMFRALSLITQITYSQLSSMPSCILIDDIGEGLDYERSSALVQLLIDKALGTPVQLIMATNDRFVMNRIPLDYWSVVQRVGAICTVLNRTNSPKIFDDFELTGLSNFDFFSTNYYLKGSPEE